MYDINDIEIYIVRYLHGEITEDELRALDSWLEESPGNKEAFFRRKAVHDMLRNGRLTSDEEVDRVSGKLSVAQVDTSLSDTWMNGEYKFKNEPLVLIFKRLEKYYDVTICPEDEKAENICYTGTFSLRQDLREVLRIINHENQFRFQQTGKEIHIKSK
jgi:ferric-dicitrate binding protein FerR (iron transport regulator)